MEDVVDEGSSGEFRSLTEVRVQPSALDFLQGDAAPFLCPVDGFHEPDIFVQLIDSHILFLLFGYKDNGKVGKYVAQDRFIS